MRSAQSEDRMRGLGLLCGLECVVLDEAQSAEESAAVIVSKMLAMKEFNFVKAAADAQQTIMKDLRERPERPEFRRDDRRPTGAPTCFECGRKGHKSFECKASEEDRKAHKERRAAARG